MATHPEKLAAVEAMDGAARYDYFLRKVADFECVWGLFSDGWASAASAEGRKLLPFWPEADFATACATGVWAAYQPKSISIGDFTSKWIPGMARDGLLVAVFPTAQSKGVFVEPSWLGQDLEAALSEYE